MNRTHESVMKNSQRYILVPGLHSIAGTIAGVCLVCLLPSAVLAQQAGAVLIDAGPCLKFETSVERLVCFEEQVKSASNAATNAPSGNVNNLPVLSIQRSSASASAPAQVRANPQAPQQTQQAEAPVMERAEPADRESLFGLLRRNEREEEEVEQPRDELVATIADVSSISTNMYSITLSNGQVWRSMQSKNYALAAGQTVRIYPTIWGSSFRLTVDELKGFIQVKRVK